jgi:prolyl-tRNA editing enzyme YbaK/EbsC (Cys-tRNA(Pro) deacylase)
MKNYEDLQKYLESKKVKGRIVQKPSTQATLDACNALQNLGYDVQPTEFIKAILMIGKDVQDRLILGMVRGIDRTNITAIQQKLNLRKLRIPPPEQALELCSYQRGGTPPIGIENLYAVVADAKLLQPKRTLFGGGGDSEHILMIDSFELQKKLKEQGVKVIIADIRE